jgi:hypothetical protein
MKKIYFVTLVAVLFILAGCINLGRGRVVAITITDARTQVSDLQLIDMFERLAVEMDGEIRKIQISDWTLYKFTYDSQKEGGNGFIMLSLDDSTKEFLVRTYDPMPPKDWAARGENRIKEILDAENINYKTRRDGGFWPSRR